MKAVLGCTALSLAVATMTVPADAKGCIKGAIVGGVAGHVAVHHGWWGAAQAASSVVIKLTKSGRVRRQRNPRIEDW
jgi:hypothetical protein